MIVHARKFDVDSDNGHELAEVFHCILMELKKINMQLSEITDNNIKKEEIC